MGNSRLNLRRPCRPAHSLATPLTLAFGLMVLALRAVAARQAKTISQELCFAPSFAGFTSAGPVVQPKTNLHARVAGRIGQRPPLLTASGRPRTASSLFPAGNVPFGSFLPVGDAVVCGAWPGGNRNSGTLRCMSWKARSAPNSAEERADDSQSARSGDGPWSPANFGDTIRSTGECALFDLESPFAPTGDQPAAVEQIVKRIREQRRFTVLRGATGTGKTFTMAQCIAKVSRPTLVLCHNKTLAAQLARELKSYFPRNCVELFVSYYNFYLPESYSPASDTYIAKSSSINEELDALRHRATRSLSERRDVIVVASVSCIYGIGLPKNYLDARLVLSVGEARAIEEHTVASSDILVWPPYEEAPLRLRFAMGQLVTIRMVGALDGSPEAALPAAVVYPARHHVTPREQLERACDLIEGELAERLAELEQEEHAAGEGITTTSDRLRHRTMVDLEAMRETGYCQGMENYSRHLAGRAAGAAPDTLVDYLEAVSGGAGGWLLVVDESHVTLPQLRGMYAADRSRKQALVRHGFRLPSALDNRPLRDGEFWDKVGDALFLSATPGELELQMVGAEGGVGASGVEEGVVDMVLRPTHVLDPEIHVRETEGQLDHLLEEVKARAARKQASLAMTITKRDAEDLAGWFVKHSVRAQYLHSGLKTIERSEVLEKLQKGELDVLVGVNLLREGLDLPQVSLVAILDADKEGFLRSDRSLIQTIGRAARHRHGTAIFYADRVTGSMRRCIDETNRRRRIQHEHNTKHGLVPQSTKGRAMASLFSIERAALKSSLAESAAWSHDRSHAAPTPAAGRAPPPPPRTEELTCEEDSEWDDTPAAEGQRGALTGVPSGVSDAEWDSHVARLRAEAARLPRSSAGVYMWRAAPQDGQGAGSGSDGAAEGEILYVGKAKRLRARALSYLVGGGRRHGPRIRAMLWRAESIECIITPGGEHDALLLEARMIKQHLPRYNVLLRDDRFYPYVCVTLHQPLPAVFSVPSKTSKEADARARFFGPYTDPSAMRSQLFLIEDVLRLRQLRFEARYGDTSGRGTAGYLEAVGLAVQILEGRHDEVGDALEARGDAAGAAKVRSAGRLTAGGGVRRELDFLGSAAEMEAATDVAAIAVVGGGAAEVAEAAVVQVMQLRRGAVAGRFTFRVELPEGAVGEEELSEALGRCLESHYLELDAPAPELVLTPLKLPEAALVEKLLAQRRTADAGGETFGTARRRKAPSVRKPTTRGKAAAVERKALELARVNAEAEAFRLGQRTPWQVGAGALAEMLALDAAPERIEAFDISHTQGAGTVASRVVLVRGQPDKAGYRRYNIQSCPDGPDDYRAMEEALARRFAKKGSGRAEPRPDVVLIDGGKGQLSAALKGLAAAGLGPGDVTVCALAKRAEEVFVPGRSEPLVRAADDHGVLLLRAARDESHRFALQQHRKVRSAALFRKGVVAR